jgi:hypothetical protein
VGGAQNESQTRDVKPLSLLMAAALGKRKALYTPWLRTRPVSNGKVRMERVFEEVGEQQKMMSVDQG